MKKKRVNYKSVIILLIAIAVGIFFGNKLAYYQMYRLQINHEKTLSIALTATPNEEADKQAIEDNKESTTDSAEDQENKSDDKIAETTVTTFTNEEKNGPNVTSVTKEDSSATSSESTNSTLININTADKATLDTLPGIGEVKAQAIIDYRSKYGNFLSTEELMNVSGIGEKTYENLKNLICV